MAAQFSFLACVVLALVSCASAARDSQGKEFILGYMENQQWKSDPLNDVELFITTVSNTPATVTVTTPKFNPSWSKTITVTRGTIQEVKVPHTIRGVGIEKSNKGVWIQSTQEISVYSVNKEPKSTDAYISLPVDVLGKEYYAMTYTSMAELLVIGTQDNTQVTIKWPTKAGPVSVNYGGNTYGKGDTLTLTLNKFETFHALQADSNADFTGAYITSNKPISVVSGNKKIPVPINAGSADHLTEMLMPVDTWGKTFMTTSTPDRSIGDVFRIVASEDSTTVTFSKGTTKSISKAGEFKDVDLSTGSYQTVTSDKPVMIAMFTKTFKNDGPHYGDPAMSLLIPEPQYASDYTWTSVKDPTGAEFNNKVAVIIEKSKKSGLLLDGSAVNWNEQKDIHGSSKIHLWVRVSPGSHNIYHNDPSVTFMALVSGTFKVNSYAYAAGLRLAQINAVCVPTPVVAGDIVDNDCDGAVDEEVLNNIDDDGDGKVDEDLALPPRVDGNWGSWGSYGTCSKSCGGSGVKTRTRNCDNPAPANNGLPCPGSGSDTATCTTGACPVHGNWGGWGSYGSCSVTCGVGSKTRTRQCNNPAPAHGGNNCAGSGTDSASCGSGTCAVNGNWGGWGSYGSCSVTCGSGSKSRTRQCNNPPPSNGGSNCAGSSTSSATCTMTPCAVHGNWGGWGSYGSCSVTCGSGSKSRTRQCDNPAPAHGGNSCAGSGTDSATCTMAACSSCSGNVQADMVFILDASGSVGSSNFQTMKTFVRDLVNEFDIGSSKVRVGVQKYSSGTNTEFHLNQYYDRNTVKSKVMGVVFTGGTTNTGGALEYMRTTMFKASNGDRSSAPNIGVVLTDGRSNSYSLTAQQASLARQAGITIFSIGIGSGIPVGELNEMATDPDSDHVFAVSGFSGLSGIKTTFQKQACVAPNAVDGKWSNWGGWGSCSKSCAGGSKTRTRSCTNPTPLYGGKQCSGASSDSATCNTHHCPVHGNWGGWGGWGTCSHSCGGGSKSRSRSCNNPAPLHGGNQCAGSGTSSTSCNTHPCAVHGNWATWSSWGTCSTTCELGSWSRSRTCTNPAPAHGGNNCAGVNSQTTSCNLRPCPVDGGWGSWQAWSACSVTCMGIGVRGRTRNCDNPTPLHGGAQCPGSPDETQTCDKRLTLCSVGNGWAVSVYSTTAGTPVNGGFSQWGQWTACSKTCGAGSRLRKRQCDNPVPKFGGTICSGDYVDKEICGNVPCPGGSSYVQTCPDRFFDCASGNITCVHYLKKCDCIPDCDDASDEDQEYAGCVAANEICQNSARTIAPTSLVTCLLLLVAAIFASRVTCYDVTL